MGKQFTIYRHITPDGKSYIGCTSNTIRERWDMGYQHNHIFSAMCRKYGWYGMQHETLATVSDESEAYKVEQEMITKYQSNNPNFGYNISMGGKATYTGLKHTEETKDKIRKANAGAVFTKEHCENLSKALKGNMVGEKNPMYGKPKSPETIQKQYDSHRHEMKPVVQLDLECNVLNTFFSIHEAARRTGISRSCICNCLRSQKCSKGFYWKYAE